MEGQGSSTTCHAKLALNKAWLKKDAELVKEEDYVFELLNYPTRDGTRGQLRRASGRGRWVPANPATPAAERPHQRSGPVDGCAR